MKTIIIPFNGSTDCLDLTETIVSVSGNEDLNCIFLSITPLPDNYNDLFSLRRSSVPSHATGKAFYSFAENCKTKYGTRVTVNLDHIYGDSPAVFRNYAQHKGADMVVFDTEQWEFSISKQRSSVFRMLSRCGCEFLYVSANNTFIKSGTDETIWEKESDVLAASKATLQKRINESAIPPPQAVVYQYSAVDEMLNEWKSTVATKHIFSKELGNMSRYFLKEIAVQKMLEQSKCSFVLLKKGI